MLEKLFLAVGLTCTVYLFMGHSWSAIHQSDDLQPSYRNVEMVNSHPWV